MMQIVNYLTMFILAVTNSIPAIDESKGHLNAPAFANLIKPKFPLRVLLTNDDSWASANIRATYYALKSVGHSVLMVAPVINESHKGGTVVLPTEIKLTSPGRDNSVNQGAPFHGSEPFDDGITYFNGTPAATTLFALDQVVPNFTGFAGKSPQLIISGPNEGSNIGPFLFTQSGTIGASYTGVNRGINAIAISSFSNPRDHLKIDYNDPTDEAIIFATNSVNFISTLTKLLNSNENLPLMPLGIGISINYGEKVNDTKVCSKVNWQLTRLTGGALTDKIIIEDSNGLPLIQTNYPSDGLNQCYNGDCDLPGEQQIIDKDQCAGTISFYSIDYDAPSNVINQTKLQFQKAIQQLLNGGVGKTNKRTTVVMEDQ